MINRMAPDAFDRLCADLAVHPDSSVLNEVAYRCGDVLMMRSPRTVLALAYLNGALVDLIVDAERLAAVVGPRGKRGYLRRAVRLAYQVRALNRRLAPYIAGGQALATVTVLASLDHPTERSVGTVERDAAAVGLLGIDCPDNTADIGPPVVLVVMTPVVRTGPPSSPPVRPRQAAPVTTARNRPDERRGAVSRAG